MIDLRCPSKKHGVIIDDNLIEIKCDSRFCDAGQGKVVLHQFNVTTGELVRTVQYKNPTKEVR